MSKTEMAWATLIISQVWGASADSGIDFIIAGVWIAYSAALFWSDRK